MVDLGFGLIPILLVLPGWRPCLLPQLVSALLDSGLALGGLFVFINNTLFVMMDCRHIVSIGELAPAVDLLHLLELAHRSCDCLILATVDDRNSHHLGVLRMAIMIAHLLKEGDLIVARLSVTAPLSRRWK